MPSTTSCVGSGTCSTSSGFSWHAQEQKIRRKQHSPPCHHPPLQPPCHRRHQSYGQRPRDRPCLGKIATVSGALGALRGASRHQRDDAGCGRRQPPPPRQRSAATTKHSVARPSRSGSRASDTVTATALRELPAGAAAQSARAAHRAALEPQPCDHQCGMPVAAAFSAALAQDRGALGARPRCWSALPATEHGKPTGRGVTSRRLHRARSNSLKQDRLGEHSRWSSSLLRLPQVALSCRPSPCPHKEPESLVSKLQN